MKSLSTLSTLVTRIINIAEPVIEALEDRKVNWIEGGEIAAAIAFNAMPVIKAAPEAWLEIQDLELEEIATIRKTFKSEFDIKDDHHERKIEAAFDFVIQVAPATAQLVKAFQ